jgi:hypothetical protein
MDNIETTGYWHFSSEPKNSYAGFLLNSDEEISVTLLGCDKLPKDFSIIHGTTTTGKKITLYECHAFNRRMAFPGIPSIKISAVYYFEGEHLTVDTLFFESAQLIISDLDTWADMGGFGDYIRDNDIISIKYKRLEQVIFFEDNDVMFALQFQATSPFFSPKHNFTITQETVLLIKHASSFDLDKFWKYISAITGFLTLAYFSDPQILKIQFKRSDRILNCNYLGQNTVEIEKKKSHRNFLFEYDIIKESFPIIFKKWVELENIIEPVVDVIQEAFAKRNTITENKFLNIIHGIETFHRRRRNNEKEPKEIYKTKQSVILDACPIEYKSWLKDKLNFGNEPTLQDRLEELFNELNPELIAHLYPDYKELIVKAKKNRNYYTHYDKLYEKKALKTGPLFYLTERLKVFLLILLLKEIQIKPEQLNRIIIEGSRFLFNHLIAKKDK